MMGGNRVSDLELEVIVIGSCNVDLIGYTKDLPKVGETVLGHKFDIGTGGKGFNQCVGAAKLGARTAMVAKIGTDQFGDLFMKTFVENEIDTSHVERIDEPTGVALISVNQNGDNHIVVIPGANNRNSSEYLTNRQIESALSTAKVILFQFEIPIETTIKGLELCRGENKAITIVNAAPALPQIPERVLMLCDIFCVNEHEAEIVTGMSIKCVADALEAATKLRNMGCKLPVITLGSDGVVFIPKDGQASIHVAVEKVEAVDTTGAGDLFLGSLAYFLCRFSALPFEELIRRACIATKYSILKPGTSVSYPRASDLPAELFFNGDDQ